MAADPDGDPLTYSWTHNSTLLSDYSSVSTPYLSFTTPSVSADTPVLFNLTATDHHNATAFDTVLVTVLDNLPPVVDAGADQIVAEGSLVTLNGTASDPEGHTPLIYSWDYDMEPSLQPISIDDSTAIDTTFTAPQVTANTTYSFNLLVFDSLGAFDVDEVIIIVYDVPNRPPVVDAGADQIVAEGSLVTLDGTATDPDGDLPLTYGWAYDGLHGSPSISIDDGLALDTTFTAPQVAANTTYTFTLVVIDNRGASTRDSVTIKVYDVPNKPPSIDAGADQTVHEGDTVTLSGMATDPEGDSMTYLWTHDHARPITMDDDSMLSTNFTAPIVSDTTTVTFTLTARDGSNIVFDTVTITVRNVPNDAPVVDAGAGQTVHEGDTVTLTGTATDPENNPMTYDWSCDAFERNPGDISIDLGSADMISVRFDAPLLTPHNTPFIAADAVAFTCTFTASDLYGYTSDTMTLIVRDIPDIPEDGPVLTLLGPDNQVVPPGSSYVDPGATCATLHDGTSLPVTTTGIVDTSAPNAGYTIKYSCEHNGRQATDKRIVTISRGNERPDISIISVRSAIEAGNTTTDYGLDAICTDREDGTLIATSSVSFHNDGRTATITYTCTDSHGSSARTTLEVAVTSSAPPGIYLNKPGIYYMNAGDAWSDPGAYCIDAEDGRIPAPATHSTVDASKPGHYTVGYTCTDSDGNSEGTVRNILVQATHQNLPPYLTISNNNDVVIPINGTLSLPSATCMDKEDGDLTHIIWLYGVEDVDTTRVGTYDIFYFCTDSEDEKVQAYLRVVVEEP